MYGQKLRFIKQFFKFQRVAYIKCQLTGCTGQRSGINLAKASKVADVCGVVGDGDSVLLGKNDDVRSTGEISDPGRGIPSVIFQEMADRNALLLKGRRIQRQAAVSHGTALKA